MSNHEREADCAGEPRPIVLVNMPFAPSTHPSLALGCLAGTLRQRGLDVVCKYANVLFADMMGLREYVFVSNYMLYALAGEWVFAASAFPDAARDDETYLSEYCSGINRDGMYRLRDLANRFIETTARDIAGLEPAIVGCTSAFTQNCASLALLRRVRELAPGAATILGGSNCEGDMGRTIHANVPYVDFVFSGEADWAMPELCERILAGKAIGGDGWNTPGLVTPADRAGGYAREAGREVVMNLSDLPDPHYDEFYHTFANTRLGRLYIEGLVLETSRGCWWGEGNACAFCGLNGLARKYRSKDPEAARKQIIRLVERHGVKSVEMTDNMLRLGYLGDLLPKLVGENLALSYEVSPKLSRDQLGVLSDAGARWVQPGLENMSDSVLSLINKDNRAYHNIRFLKWARELGISVIWNSLYNFPGEDPAWYGEVAALLPLLSHLQPPSSANSPLRIDRFSRYHREPERFGLELRPLGSYAHVYPFGENALWNLAYFFERVGNPAADPANLPEHMQRLIDIIGEWKALFLSLYPVRLPNGTWHQPPMLGITINPDGGADIVDTRPVATAGGLALSPLQAAVYQLCDGGEEFPAIAGGLPGRGFPCVPEDEVRAILDRFVTGKIMVRVSGRYLGLALRQPCRSYYGFNRRPGGGSLRSETDPRTVWIDKVFGVV